jgi:hypothetical protein
MVPINEDNRFERLQQRMDPGSTLVRVHPLATFYVVSLV